MTITFDVETLPDTDERIARVEPEFEAPANYKDPAKIAESIAQQRAKWREDAALHAQTARVACIGTLAENVFEPITNTVENYIIERFWNDTNDCLAAGHAFIGFNCFGFDLPFLIRRSWILGIEVPTIVRRTTYSSPTRPRWNDNIVDLMELWGCGNREQRISLDILAKALGVGQKTGDGKDFPRLWATDRTAAIAYLKTDVELIRACAKRMGVGN